MEAIARAGREYVYWPLLYAPEDGAGYAVSFDAGATWTTAALVTDVDELARAGVVEKAAVRLLVAGPDGGGGGAVTLSGSARALVKTTNIAPEVPIRDGGTVTIGS